MNGALTQLMSAGADAFTNLWDVNFILPVALKGAQYGGGKGDTWSIRVSDFDPPEFKTGTYPTDYKGVQLTRSNVKIEANRILKFTFRLDASYGLYRDLKRWKHIFFDPSGDGNIAFGMYSDASAINSADGRRYGAIEVVGYKSTQDAQLMSVVDSSNIALDHMGVKYIYRDVVCLETGEPKFVRGESNALTVSATFMFGRYVEPGDDQGTELNIETAVGIPNVTIAP